MKDDIKLTRNRFINSVINSRKGKLDLKMFSASKKPNYNNTSSNIELNKLNIRELSKLSDRPIRQENEHSNIRNKYFSIDNFNNNSKSNNYISNIRVQKNINLNNIYNYNNYITNCKKSFVIFTDPPKKLSDYILKDKSNSKKKVYKMIFIEEAGRNENKNPYYYENNLTNVDNFQNIRKSEINMDKYKKLKKYSDLYLTKNFNNNNNYNQRKFSYKINNLYRTKEKIENIIKIQSIWKGYRIRKIYQISKIYRIICNRLFQIRKTYIKEFIIKLKKVYNSRPANNSHFENQKLNRRDKIYVNKYYPNKINNKNSYNSYIYNRKNKSPGNYFSLNKKKSNNVSNNIHIQNLKTISNKEKEKVKNNYNILNNRTYKSEINKHISNLIKYINKKTIFLHFPTILYRLRILQKINLFQNRYKILYNLIKIRDKTKLYLYLQKYRNIVFVELVSDIKANSNIISSNKNTSKIQDNNKIRINIKKRNYFKNNINLNVVTKRNTILTKLINKIDLKIKKLLLEKYFTKWKKMESNRIIIVPSLKSKFEASNIITKYNSTVLPKKKQIKFKRLKSSFNSKILSGSAIKNKFNSFDTENINVKKMKVHKMNILLDPTELKKEETKDLNLIHQKNSSDNSYFISKIANVTNKINIKNTMFKFFRLWKKKSKE